MASGKDKHQVNYEVELAKCEGDRKALTVELDILKSGKNASELGKIVQYFIKWGAIAIISMYVYRSIDALAGRTTAADIGLKILGNLTISQGIAWATGVAGAAVGVKEHKLRKSEFKRLTARNAALEAKIDPTRTSSNLTPDGDTRPEDK